MPLHTTSTWVGTIKCWVKISMVSFFPIEVPVRILIWDLSTGGWKIDWTGVVPRLPLFRTKCFRVSCNKITINIFSSPPIPFPGKRQYDVTIAGAAPGASRVTRHNVIIKL